MSEIAKPLIFAADVSPLAEPTLYRAACALVTPERRARAERFHFAKDRQLCLGAGLLLRCGLRTLGVTPPESLVLAPGGKPQLPGGKVQFNLSHSGVWAICALGDTELGCDVERISPTDLKAARRFCPSERAAILAEPSEEARRKLFYRFWTLKESFLKATGQGMALPLDSFEIQLEPELRLRQSADPRQFSLREFDELPGYCCALCTAGECGAAALRVLELRELLE